MNLNTTRFSNKHTMDIIALQMILVWKLKL